jgi:hypothetical protein
MVWKRLATDCAYLHPDNATASRPHAKSGSHLPCGGTSSTAYDVH